MAIIKVINGKKHVIANNIIKHNQLEDRTDYGCHPIRAIRDLPEKLTQLKDKDAELQAMIEGLDTFIFEVNDIDSLIDEMIEENKELTHIGFNNHCSLEYAVDYFTRMNTRPKEIYCCHGSQSHSIKKRIHQGMKQFADKVVVF